MFNEEIDLHFRGKKVDFIKLTEQNTFCRVNGG